MAASPESKEGSSPQAFSFGDLGKPRSSSRLLPAIKDVDPDASSELELGADDILESNDIDENVNVDAFEQAAAGLVGGFDNVAPDGATMRGAEGPAVAAPVPVILSSPGPAPRPSFSVPPAPAPPTPKTVPPPSPKPMIAAAPIVLMPPPVVVPPPVAVAIAPAPAPAPEVPALVVPERVAMIFAPESEPEPAPLAVITAPPLANAPTALAPPTTMMGMPAAPITSPLPLEDSVIVDEHDNDNDDEEGILRTQEIRGHQLAQVAQAAAFLDGDIPESTQILARSDMPTQMRQPQHTPAIAVAGAPTAPAWANGRHPQSAPMRAAPVAVDLPRRQMPIAAEPRPAKKEMSPLLIGGLLFAAAALVGVVGVGGYFASRSMSEKPSMAIAPAPTADEPSSTSTTTTTTSAANDTPAGTVDPPVGAVAAPAASAGIDVSSLPAAGVALPPAATTTPQHPAAIAAAAVAPPPAATHNAAPPPPAGRAGAPLPPPGAVAAAPTSALPPPAKAAAAAPAAPAVQATTGNVNVDPKLRAILVDGNYRHVSDSGSVTLTCGAHRIKVGMNDTQSVNVPCGGSISL